MREQPSPARQGAISVISQRLSTKVTNCRAPNASQLPTTVEPLAGQALCNTGSLFLLLSFYASSYKRNGQQKHQALTRPLVRLAGIFASAAFTPKSLARFHGAGSPNPFGTWGCVLKDYRNHDRRASSPTTTVAGVSLAHSLVPSH